MKKQTLNHLFQIDTSNFIHYPKDYPEDLPKRDAAVYLEIEKFEDYEYTNNIAYEMLIRTTKYKELMSVALDDRDEVWKEDIRSLGLDPSLVINLLDSNLKFWYFGKRKEQFFYEDLSSFTISDLDNGLKRLIEFYIDKNEIYSISKKMNTSSTTKGVSHDMKKVLKNIKPIEYKHETNLTSRKVLENKKAYYIPCISLPTKLSTSTSEKQMFEITKDLPLELLEKDFVETIKDEISLYKHRKIAGFYSRPLLRFKESMLVDISVNLDLPEKELVAYIKRVKAEYKSNPSSINSIYEIINDTSLTKEEVSFEKTKQFIANAFYCYDYFTARKEYIESENKHNEILNIKNYELQEKKEELEFLKKNKSIDNKTERIKSLKDEIKKLTKKKIAFPAIKKKSDNYIFGEEWFSYSKINSNSAYDNYLFIKDFIENEKYKQLLHSKLQ